MRSRITRLALLVPLLGFAACGDSTESIAPEPSLVPGEPTLAVRLEGLEDHPGNPFYALLFNGLLALPSAMVGSADRFFALYVNGLEPDDRLMNRLSASGSLRDGRAFRVQAVERPAGTEYQVEFR